MQTINDLGSYTITALFRNTLAKFSDCNSLALVDTEPLTYQQLGDRVFFFAKILNDLGVTKGDRVALFSTSSPDWGACYFSSAVQGIVSVPLLPDFSVVELKAIFEHSNVKGIFVSEKLYPKIKDISQELLPFIFIIETQELIFSGSEGNRDSVIYSTEKPSPINQKSFNYTDVFDLLNNVPVKEDDLASIVYTSGTTGRSKGVMLTHKNLVFTAIQCQTVYRVHKLDKCLSFLPLSHVYEFTIGFLMMILCGASIYYLGRPPAVSTLLPALAKIRPTVMLSVPIIMEKIYKNKIFPTFTKKKFLKKLYSIRFIQFILHRIAGKQLKKTFGGKLNFFGIGGAKLDPVVEQFLKDAKFPYAIGYGLTETSPLLAGSNPKNTKVGTIGPILQGIELRIINPDENGVGEVVAKGANVMKGYYNSTALTTASFTDKTDSCGEGWFKTGDLGFIDKKGRLSLKGRLKNMILGASGENIYPEDIEFVINQHPMVQESLVVESSEGLVAYVQLDNDKIKNAVKKGNPQELLNAVTEVIGDKVQELKDELKYLQEDIKTEIKYFVNEKVNKFSKIDKVHIIEEFEKTASQKIKRYLYNLKK